jgi:tetratricopeptide (TPR) repeat protein
MSVVGLGTRDARADSDETRAFSLFEQSERAYERGRFDEALVLLRRSYELKPEPVLLYNMGRAYEGLGDLASAATSYETFIAAQPTTPDRGALERRIATLRNQIAEREALKKQAERDRATEKPRGPSSVPWIVAGVGAASIGAGGVVGWLAVNKHDEASKEPTYVAADRLQSEASSLATTANVFFIVGGAVLTVGLVWGILDVSATRRAASASPNVGSIAW